MPENDLQKKMDAQIAYANAPWVPVSIDSGGLGNTNLIGTQDQLVKKGYSFNLAFQPFSNFPFRGWQAWTLSEGVIAYWKIGDAEAEEADEIFGEGRA
jgi:hypothetical protein